MAERRGLAATLVRFGLVGLVNTAVGLAIILALQFGAGVGAHAANAAGYAVGLVVGFTLNRRFVFERGGGLWGTGARYGAAALAAFGFNQMILWLANRILGPGAMAGAAAQCIAVASYTALFFVLCRAWVFAAPTARQSL